MENMDVQHGGGMWLGLVVSLLNASIGAGSTYMGYVTKSNVSWGMGVVAFGLSGAVAFYTIKEKRLSIKKLEREIRDKDSD